MPTKKMEQINFRVSARFRQLIESECIGREMSLQDFITAAVKFYSQTPRDDWKTADILTVSYDAEGFEEGTWVRLWAKYLNTMPEEKVRLIVEVMKLDLLHYRSSRRKAALKKRRRMDRQEESNAETRVE
jgi:hypothetical protein